MRVGALGWCTISPGMYVYTGRAARGLPARVRRHASRAKRKHWHIDYLLARREAVVVRIALASPNPDEECRVNQQGAAKGATPIAGFGASDCRERCGAHLVRL